MRPLVSVLTPTWNRANYLERVWKGLCSQSYTAIEWIVADDCSVDDTRKRIHELAKASPFPIKLISANVHIGKAYMDNRAVEIAKGEFILWCDSDDYLLPNAIQRLVEAWESIPEAVRDTYVGVTGLCTSNVQDADKGHVLIGPDSE